MTIAVSWALRSADGGKRPVKTRPSSVASGQWSVVSVQNEIAQELGSLVRFLAGMNGDK
jgi:hypothetical protein